MATVHTVIVIAHEDKASIAEIKAILDDESTSGETGINQLINILSGCAGGAYRADVELTIRDTDPAVSTNGTGSVQRTYNCK